MIKNYDNVLERVKTPPNFRQIDQSLQIILTKYKNLLICLAYLFYKSDRFSKFKLFVFKEIKFGRIFFTKYDNS